MRFFLQKKLAGTLAFRVLLTSFAFIIIPLILYSLIIYDRAYEEKVHDVFQEMEIFQKDQINVLLQIEESTLNFLEVLSAITPDLSDSTILDPILQSFVYRGNLTALFHLTLTPNHQLLCTSSTLPAYLHRNFTTDFPFSHVFEAGTHVFIDIDPILKYSLFMTVPITNNEGIATGVIGASIGLDELLASLDGLRHIEQANLSILKLDGEILASSDKSRVGKRLVNVTDKKVLDDPNTIKMKKIPFIPHGFKFYFNHESRFLTFARIPYTDTDLSFSIPTRVVLIKIYETLSELAFLLVFILIIGGLVSYLFTLRLAKPLAALNNVMEKVGEGQLEERYQKDPMGFEINYLGEHFNQMVASLTNYIEEVKRERASKEVYLKELQIGHEIQHSILPKGEPEFPGVVVATFFQAAKEVAGDFYDWIIKDDTLLITIADGVGKGISACLYSFDLRSVIRAFSSITNDLKEIAFKTNTIFCQDTKETGNFVTAFLAKYQSSTRELSFVNCGHNYPIVRRANGTIEKLEVHGLAFGIEKFDHVEMKTVTLQPGDVVIFYTDGLTDAQNSSQILFGEKRFIETITNFEKTLSPEEMVGQLLRANALFTEGEEQFDDMTLLILKVQ